MRAYFKHPVFWALIASSLMFLLLRVPAQAQEFTSRYFHYNQYFDAPAPFTITANTIDAADTNGIRLCGGGACTATRGASIFADGNERGNGQLYINGGGTTSSNLYFSTFSTAAADVVTRWVMPPSATNVIDDLVFGDSATASSVATIRGARADGSDDGKLMLTPGGAGDDPTRGPYLTMYGNENASTGDVYLSGGQAGSLIFQSGDNDSNTSRTRITIPDDNSAENVDIVLGRSATTTPAFAIRAQTADGDDDGTLKLCSGGDCFASRGALIMLYGNELAGGTGGMTLYSGNASGAAINLNAYASDGVVGFYTNNSLKLTIDAAAADADDVNLILGKASTTAPIFTIRGQTADGDDDGTINMCPGGACGSTRGAQLQLVGNEGAGAGSSTLTASAVANAGINLVAYNGNAAGVNIQNSAGYLWKFNTTTGDLTQDATNGGSIIQTKANTGLLNGLSSTPADIAAWAGTAPLFAFSGSPVVGLRGTNDTSGPNISLLKSRKTDGTADTVVQNGDAFGSIYFTGADGTSFQAGARIQGFVDGTPGAGDMPGRIEFQTSTDGTASPLRRWYVDSAGAQIQDVTNGGNIVFQRDGYGIVDSPASVAATGADLAGAAAITAVQVLITDADGAKGVKFPAAPIGGQRYAIYNTANAVLKVYPGEAGDQINAAGAGTAVDVAAYGSLYCHAASGAQIWCGEMANP